MDVALTEKIPKRLLLAHGVGGGLFLLIQLFPLIIPDIRLLYFSEPAALIAAAFMGVPMRVGPESILLSHSAIEVAVTEACSGFDFFALLAALLIGLIVFRHRGKHIIRDIILIFAIVYGLTIFANTSRIVCAVQIRAATGDFIPSFLNGSIHQTIGVIVFVTILALSWTSLTKYYERKRNT